MELNLTGIHFLDPISDHIFDREIYPFIDLWLELPGDQHRRRVNASTAVANYLDGQIMAIWSGK